MAPGRALCLAAGALPLLVGAAPSSAETLLAVRHIARPSVTTLILEFSAPVRYRLQQADARQSVGVPPRLYVDLPDTRLAPGTVVPGHLPEGPLRRVRAGARPSGMRLILDVPGLTEYGAFPMHDPFRLIVDVRAGVNREKASPLAKGGPRGGRIESRQPPPDPLLRKEGESATDHPSLPGSGRGQARGTRAPRQNDSTAVAARQRPVKRLKVVVDPGHGGKDPGAVGAGGVAEKDVVLAIARELRRTLQASGDFDVILTRDDDTYLPLQARTARANDEDADLFLSIHANASPNRERSGAETYYLNDTEDQATLRLARMENGLRSATGDDGHDRDAAVILSSLIQNYKVEESTALAEEVQRGLVAALRGNGTPVQDLGVKRGPFYVLVGAGMPCVLVEVSFISHPREGRRLAQPAYQKAVARGLLQGLKRFAENTEVAQNL